MAINRFKIIQHNVLNWQTRKNELSNIYLKEDPDIIRINSHCVKNNENIKIFGYNVYQKNSLNEDHAGVAIAIKRNIRHELIDDFDEDFLALKLNTNRGPFVIGTAYMPPRRQQFPYPDIMKIIRRNTPAYLIADLNAKHRTLGQSTNNFMGTELVSLIHQDMITHLAPEFGTFISARGKGRPDIIIGNKNAHLNYAIQEGPLTTSDHIPIVFTLSTSPIMIPQIERYNQKRANWELFKDEITEEMNDDIHTEEETPIIDKDYIDQQLDSWYDTVGKAMDKAIPKKKYLTLPHPLTSDRIKLLQWRYKNILDIVNYLGWTPILRNQHRDLQAELNEESKMLYTKHWNDMIKEIEIEYNNPKKFWGSVRKLTGGNNESSPYLIDEGNKKLFDNKEKEIEFRRFWENIFKINPEDNEEFDRQHEQMVENYINNNMQRLRPYINGNSNRLNNNNSLTKPIEVWEIKTIIRNFKDKAPGESGIRKTVMQNLPNVAIIKLKDIYNWALSMGYYPIKFKNAIMILIPKPGKDPTKAENYRPISLLEIPGKIFEKIINNRITLYMENNDLFNSSQYGFRRKRGTQLALAAL